MKTLRVVAAVICDDLREKNQILATARGYGQYRGQWEFPGGKIEPGESPEDALRRELREELCVEIELGPHIRTVEMDYPEFHLSLSCWWCAVTEGKLQFKEAADHRWLRRDELESVSWLPADRALLPEIAPQMSPSGKQIRFEGIRAILWDVDGTILDFFESQKNAIRFCFQQYGLGECTDEMLLDYDGINHRYWQALERGELSKREILTGRFYEFFRKYGLPTDAVEAFNSEYQVRLGDTVSFYPGVLEVIQAFHRQGMTQFVVTNGTKVAQVRKLERSGLNRLMDGVFISEDVGSEKPSLSFFEPVLRALKERLPDIQLREILMIGDSPTSDMQLGKNAGIRTCWFRRSPEAECTLPVDYVISDFRSVDPEIS